MDSLELLQAAVICILKTFYFIFETVYRRIFPSPKDVAGKVVLITGSGGGIGRLTAMKFGALGCKVVLWDINDEQNTETARLVRLSSQKGAEAFPFNCDVTNREQVYKTAEEVKKTVGSVDILINNAGIVQGKSLLDLKDEEIIKTFNVNSLSHFWTCKAFLPDMIEKNSGHIVSISSVAGLYGSGALTDYCASKFAVVGFHESLMLELMGQGNDGITGTIVHPYFINTGMFDGVDSPFPLVEADYAADQIVSAVLNGKEVLMFPFYFGLLKTVSTIIPAKALSAIYMALKGPEIMKSFRGHASS